MSEGRIRAKRNKFSQISNSAIDTLDPVALWLYAKMYSKANIPGYNLFKKVLEIEAKENRIGKDRFNRAWSLLIKKGYLKQYRMQNDKGHFYYEYEVLEEPEADYPELHEDQTAAARQLNDHKPIQEASTPHTDSPVPGYPHTGQPHTGRPVTGKQPPNNNNNIYNNTRLNNTAFSSSTTKYTYTTAEKEELKAVPDSVKSDTCYKENAVLSTVEDNLELKPTSNDLNRILKQSARRYKRKELSSGTIKKPFAYFLEIVADVSQKKTNTDQITDKQDSTTNRFHNFHQREYDFDQLEKDLLAAQW